jgi:hypothetical protein
MSALLWIIVGAVGGLIVGVPLTIYLIDRAILFGFFRR